MSQEKMFVIKRNGEKAPVKFDSITKRNEQICKDLKLDIDCGKLSQKVINGLKSGMTTIEIDNLSSEEAYYLSSRNPDYGTLAAHIAISNHQKQCPKTFRECIEQLYNYTTSENKLNPLISKDVYNFAIKHMDILEKTIDNSKDFKYDYFGFKTLQKSYLLPFGSKKCIETPQYMLMRVFLGIYCEHNYQVNLGKKLQKYLLRQKLNIYIKKKSNEELKNMDWFQLIAPHTTSSEIEEKVKKIERYIKKLTKPLEGSIDKIIDRYRSASEHLYTPASPTLFNSGTNYPQMASCFLLSIPDDLSQMYKFLGKIAKISARAGGIGLDLSLIRAKGSKVSSTQAESSGILPYMRILDNQCLQVSQGRRKGSFAIYLQPTHPEIMTFLQVRLPNVSEEIRCHNIFTAFYANDLFFERVENNGIWSLFCPSKLNLTDLYGEEYKKAYLDGENKMLYNKQLPAREVYKALCLSREKSGTPYLLNKDAINEKNAQKNLGTIRLSNLCTEILEYTDKKNIAVCNLTSIALPRFIKPCIYSKGYFEHKIINLCKPLTNIVLSYLPDTDLYFDFEHFGEIVETCVENCDRIIDINLYPVKETKHANKTQRPIGIGVQGLSDVYKMLKYSWTSKESSDLNKSIFSTMYYHFLKKTNELGIKYGSYPAFKGSPASKGILQYHMWKQEPDTSVISKQKWNQIEEDIKKGMRNSLGIALMPTASTSQILGNIESIEVSTYNLYTRGTLAGTFSCLDKHLYKELKNLGKWNDKTINQIIKDRGSVQKLDISNELKDIYRTVWELKQKYVIDQSADRGPYIDQTQSLNIHIEIPTLSILSSMDLYAWKKRLKTLSYYTRSKAAMDAVMFTVMEDTVKEKMKIKGKELNNDEESNKNEESNNEEEMAKSVCYKGCVECSS